jgi:hypothetical protein
MPSTAVRMLKLKQAQDRFSAARDERIAANKALDRAIESETIAWREVVRLESEDLGKATAPRCIPCEEANRRHFMGYSEDSVETDK